MTQTDVPERLLTLTMAAEILGLHVESVRRLASKGRIPGAVRVWRSWRIRASAIDRIVAEGIGRDAHLNRSQKSAP